MEHYCVQCGLTFPHDFHALCAACGGLVDVRYDPRRVQLHDSPNPYERFSALLPIQDPVDRLPTSGTYSPLVHSLGLGRWLRMPALYLKDETVHPTGTTKDRMAAVSLAYLWERGVREFCTSSTGNSSTAYAHAITAHPGMRVNVFTAEDFVSRVGGATGVQVVHHCLRDASFVDAFDFANVYAQRNHLVSERGFFNVGRREGLKLAFLEACDQAPGPIDWYFQATSSAMGVWGTDKGARELLQLKKISRRPRLVCAQQESCAPMVRAAEEGSATIQPRHIVAKPRGIAEAILRGDPSRTYPYIRRIVLESNGRFLSVNESEIREARRIVEELEGLSPCFASSTAVAALIKWVRQGDFPGQETVMINLTGRDREAQELSPQALWYVRRNGDWVREG